MEKDALFETTKPSQALRIMAVPTIASQIILLVYNLADTWFIGRTNNPYMIAAASLGVTVYLVLVSISNVFGVGGGSLMTRLRGERNDAEAERVASYSISMVTILSVLFSFLVFLFLTPLLTLLGASPMTLPYAGEYVFATTVLGGVPTVLTMCMAQLVRNAGYSREAGLGVALGSLLNIGLDPLFMFVLLPEGREVLGAGIATMLSNVCSFLFFVVLFHRLREQSVLRIPRKLERLNEEQKRSLYSVGIPAAISVFLFDLVTIVINRLTADYGDHALAAMGIALKLERIPINVGLGICLGMVPLVAYNYGAKNRDRVNAFFRLARNAVVLFSIFCMAAFLLFSTSIANAFIKDAETVRMAARFLRIRCTALPFMMMGYVIVNYMNAINRGRTSFLLALIRHVLFIIPLLILLNGILGLSGLLWAQLTADFFNTLVAMAFYRKTLYTLHWM